MAPNFRGYAQPICLVPTEVARRNMRIRQLVLSLGTLAMLACAWLLIRYKASERSDLSAIFLTFTNNPGVSVFPRLSVISDGRGPHALFAVSNISQVQYVQFGIAGIEKAVGDVWRDYSSPSFMGPLGMSWSPGHGYYYAVPWPTGLSLETPWRLRLWVKREPRGLRLLINQRVGGPFHPWGQHFVTSSVVRPVGIPTSARATDAPKAQSVGPVNGIQPIHADTNRTSDATGSRR